MPLLAQHGSKEGGKIASGLEKGFINGAIMSPRDLTLTSLKLKIDESRRISADALILFDPQIYAALIAKEPGARMGNLLSDYSDYFSETQIKDLRREKQIIEVVRNVFNFQRAISGLNGTIMPNIMIEDGLRSESANIAKLFFEISDEFAAGNGSSENTWLTLALGNSCFRSTKDLEDLANEITGIGLKAKGVYLLCETSPGNGVNPWHEPHMLAGLMYLNYVFSSSGYDVINGYSFKTSPYLAAAGGAFSASGWYNTSRYYSLDRFRASGGMAKRPNRKYMCRALWKRMDFATIRPFLKTFPWLLNGYFTDEMFESDNPTDEDECHQHWETVKIFTNEIVAKAGVKERTEFLGEELIKAQQFRSKIIALAIPNYDDQVRDLQMALTRFRELAEF
jgi:hypothetical protein